MAVRAWLETVIPPVFGKEMESSERPISQTQVSAILLPLTLTLSPTRLCRNGGKGKNVMLNLFQHLIKSNGYETLKRVQGDKTTIVT